MTAPGRTSYPLNELIRSPQGMSEAPDAATASSSGLRNRHGGVLGRIINP